MCPWFPWSLGLLGIIGLDFHLLFLGSWFIGAGGAESDVVTGARVVLGERRDNQYCGRKEEILVRDK